MKERPILFNTAMVQAILAGRKTETRRMVALDHVESIEFMGGSSENCKEFPFAGITYGQLTNDDESMGDAQWLVYCTEYPEEGCIEIGHGLGAVGDRLWVRETFQGPLIDQGGDYPDGCEFPEYCVYKADGKAKPEFTTMDDETVCRWRPSIHMPRWACRIILEITGVRVERLQDITKADAKAEGFDYPAVEGMSWKFNAKHNFKFQWDQIYKNWSENPWVWVVEFKVLTTNGKVTEVAA